MSKLKTTRPRAHEFYDVEDQGPLDFDPEDNRPEFSESDGSDSEDGDNRVDGGRQHYAPVEKSKLRHKELAILGPQYSGSRIARKSLSTDDDRDPFVEYDDGELSDPGERTVTQPALNEDVSADEMDNLSEEEDTEDSDQEMDDGSGTSGTSLSGGEGDGEDGQSQDNHGLKEDRAQLRKIMNEEPGSVAATIAQANKIDVEKGEAVKQQRKTFDSILNGRIRLQQALVAINSLQSSASNQTASFGKDVAKDAEIAAVKLWNTLETLRQTMQETRTITKRKRFEASAELQPSRIWLHMKEIEKDNKAYRRSVLERWSTKTQGATTQPATRRLTGATRQNTIVNVLDEQLSSKERLIKRTRTPRSCAPIQANAGVEEAADIFDDADFYGLMLKELLEQRSIEAASNVPIDSAVNQWQAIREAKTKKNVDTKASKGRKLRYTVHEKLQNFMAPENTATWTERQTDELFGSLLGKRLMLGENDVSVDVDGVDDNAEENALMLFRN